MHDYAYTDTGCANKDFQKCYNYCAQYIFLQDDEETFSEAIHPMLKITKPEIVLLIMTFFMRHNLTQVALVDFLKLINLILGAKVLPETHYSFIKYCSKSSDFFKNHYCGDCNFYIGKINKESLKGFTCENCSSSSIKYFLTNSIESKLKDILNRNYESIMEYKNKIKNDSFCDIVQGKFMTSFQNIKNFSISFNTDGVALYGSNLKKSFWPIIVTLNDLPPKLRYLKKI